MLRAKKYRGLRNPINNLADISIIKHQESKSSSYYKDNNCLLSSSYVCGVHIRILTNSILYKNNQIKMKFLMPISYAINKVNYRVANFSKMVRGINVYIEEESGLTETRWPDREDKDLRENGIYIDYPCVHINCKEITKINKIKSRSGLFQRAHSEKLGTYGVPDLIYSDPSFETRKFSKQAPQDPVQSIRVIAILIHEIGHILHAQRTESKERFWEGKRANRNKDMQDEYTTPANIAEQVSGYAISQNSSNEFVAEVFTGLIYGIKYSPEVLEYYKRCLGPELIGL
ncbi:hypothetical protein [Xenorhabdus miraniensis]|uniref:Uncharacterized protein n=1 Tax=Xenorhabdus miraniensis TaxID=351674 RepID=A0A2D0JVD7_9GAMM|nr:hypothetical protein [Xenorhabdus miraniensis]PHM50317.1 hypothetical protein Xmir_00496 [Xenorhabdus miraniensis]